MRAILQKVATRIKDRIVRITDVPVTRTKCTIYVKGIELDTTDSNQYRKDSCNTIEPI